MSDETISLFLKRLDAMPSGARTALKRESGIMLQQADGNAVRAFYSSLPQGVPESQEDRWFAAACLKCLFDPPQGETHETGVEKWIGDAISREILSESMRHRVQSMLDLSWDEDGFMLTKLSQIVRIIRQKESSAELDFAALLKDLLHWNNDRQYVQRKWARAIYRTDITENESDI